MAGTPTRSPLKELQIPASLSIRSPVTATSSAGKLSQAEEVHQYQKENCVDLDEKTTGTVNGDKYSFIANLDDQLDDVKWEERTSVITAIDHMAYLDTASKIVEDIMETVVVDSESESSVNTSFSSAIRMGDSDSEYESAVESIGPLAAEELVDEILDNVDIGNMNDMMEVIRNEVEGSQDCTITFTPTKEVFEDREDTVTPVAIQAQHLLGYRATRGSEEDMTPDRGFARSILPSLAALATPSGTPQAGNRRQTLGSLSDCFNKINLRLGMPWQ